MSYGPPIETLEEWNERLAACGCCQMPVCPVPVPMESYKAATVDAANTDHSPSTGETLGAWGPFAEPAGLPEDDLPAIYRVLMEELILARDGTATVFASTDDGGSNPVYTTGMEHYTLTWGGDADQWVLSGTQCSYILNTGGDFNPADPDTWHWDESISGCDALTDYQVQFGVWYDDNAVPRLETITATTLEVLQLRTYTNEDSGTVPPAPPSPPDPGYGYGFAEGISDHREEKQITKATLLDPIDKAGLEAAAEAAAEAADWSEWVNATPDTLPTAHRMVDWPAIQDLYTEGGIWPQYGYDELPPPTGATADRKLARLRFRIPHPFGGTYFLITFDAVLVPQDTAIEPYVLAEDVTLEWTGPGDQADPHSATWLTPIYLLPTPSIPGTILIRNVRYICYQQTPWGTPPPTPFGHPFPPATS